MPSIKLPSKSATTAKCDECHSLSWWTLKVVCGAILIGVLILKVIYTLNGWFSFPTIAAQAMVLAGGLCTIWHYLLLKRRNLDVSRPSSLEQRYGLYRFVRHPMYLGDAVCYSGLFLLFPNAFSAIVLALAWFALERQARIEDRFMDAVFGSDFPEWRDNTRLLIPYLY